jgi:hypothetical protein
LYKFTVLIMRDHVFTKCVNALQQVQRILYLYIAPYSSVLRIRIRDPVLFYPPDPGYGSGIRDGAMVGSGSGIRDK